MKITEIIGRKSKKDKMATDRQMLLEDAQWKLDTGKRDAAMLHIREAIAQKQLRVRPSSWELLRMLVQNITKEYWIGQGIFVLTAYFCLHQMKLLRAEKGDYLLWFSLGAALMGLIGICELGKHVSYHMMELEQSCYFNLKQVWTINMILFGSVDILVLSCLSAVISRRTQMEFAAICVYLFVPFVLSNLCYLLLFTAVRCGGRRYWQLAAGAAMGVLSVVPSLVPRVYYITYLWVWILILAVGVVLLMAEFCTVNKRFTQGEVLCWN